MLFVLLTGFWPFSGPSQEELTKNIEEGNIEINETDLPEENGILDLLLAMLDKNPHNRPTIKEILSHPFLEGCNQEIVANQKKKRPSFTLEAPNKKGC